MSMTKKIQRGDKKRKEGSTVESNNSGSRFPSFLFSRLGEHINTVHSLATSMGEVRVLRVLQQTFRPFIFRYWNVWPNEYVSSLMLNRIQHSTPIGSDSTCPKRIYFRILLGTFCYPSCFTWTTPPECWGYVTLGVASFGVHSHLHYRLWGLFSPQCHDYQNDYLSVI